MRLRTSTLVAAAAAVLLIGPASAQAEPAPPGTVDITVTSAGFTAPTSVPAGAVTLRVRSSDPDGAWIGLVKLRPGVDRGTYLAHLRDAMSEDPARSVAGGLAVTKDVVMLGGAAVAAVPASATMIVEAGDYLLVDFRDVGEPDFDQRVRPLRIGPGAGPLTSPIPASVIVATDREFHAPRTIRSGAPVLMVNMARQFTEAMFMPVRPGTALADLDRYFAGTGGSPFTGGPTGVVPMSTWHAAVLSTALPPGEYALVTWVRNLRTGRLLVQDGARALVTVS